MQIGFNSDVEHNGTRFHVQTEDLGLDDGRITSQIFREGQIVDTLTVSYAKAVAKLDDPEARDEEIRKRMKALHALCFRNVRGGKYEAQVAAREPSGTVAAPEAAPAPKTAAPGTEEFGRPLPVSGDPSDTADEGGTQPDDTPDPTVSMQSLPDMPALTPPENGAAGTLDRDIDVVEEVVVDNVTVESDLISLDSLPVVTLDSAEDLVAGPRGIPYRRDVKAFRGIDAPGDPDLVAMLATFRL